MFDTQATGVLKAWLLSEKHFDHPYPTPEEHEELSAAAGISVKQVKNWFVNARKRIWQPLIEKQYESLDGKLIRKTTTEPTPDPVPPPSLLPLQSRPQLPMMVGLHHVAPLPCPTKTIQELPKQHQAPAHVSTNNGNKRARHDVAPILRTSSSVESSSTSGALFSETLASFQANAMSKPKPNSLRKGLWTEAEERYARKLMEAFMGGLLPQHPRMTLRTYVANELRCDPMRISKKFSKESRVGKMHYPSVEDHTSATTLRQEMQHELELLRRAYVASIGASSLSSMGKPDGQERGRHKIATSVSNTGYPVLEPINTALQRDLDALEEMIEDTPISVIDEMVDGLEQWEDNCGPVSKHKKELSYLYHHYLGRQPGTPMVSQHQHHNTSHFHPHPKVATDATSMDIKHSHEYSWEWTL